MTVRLDLTPEQVDMLLDATSLLYDHVKNLEFETEKQERRYYSDLSLLEDVINDSLN